MMINKRTVCAEKAKVSHKLLFKKSSKSLSDLET